ncbi:TonB-dependent siderophore receptor [Sphingobacterium spiritivorum]|uniref:TonB-dependent siderophore receptor n=1 Tax=Sphingobacterium spiritivorum TaxID=258 RepID=UPI001917ADDE|nr:TonB-dependent siderophore receptor [Sphingobacterium spiritivorum]QQT26035.1 TonB-dependent receptor [Sphingobacterium spiritivorum]
MKTKIAIFLALCSIMSFSYAQTSRITGTVKTSDGHIAENVVVLLNGGKASKVSEQGIYEFNNLKPGNYKITARHIGLTSKTIEAEVSEGESKVVDFILADTKRQLDEVLVEGLKGLVEEQPSSSLRVQTPLLELPQSVQVISSSVLSKQQIFNLADGAIRNVSGVSRQSHWNDMYVNIHMRGSQIQAFRNGMNVVSSFWSPLSEDMSTVERIEFVKGPAGFMMSSGDPAGIYNVVTKKPTAENKGEVTFSAGSFEALRSTLDLNGRLSKDGKLLMRMNVAADRKSSFRPNENNKRFVIAPVLSYELNDDTKLTFEYTYQKAKMTDVGSAYVMSPFGYKSLPRDFTFSMPGLEPFNVDEHSAFLTIEHQLAKDWKLTGQGAYFNYNQIGASSWPKDITADGKVIRKSDIWDAQSEMAMGQIFLNGQVRTGSIQHRILAGLDVGDKKYDADWNQSQVLDSLNGGEFDPQNPDYTPDFGFKPFDRSLPVRQRSATGGGAMATKYSSVYIQDELGFFEDALRLTLAGRLTTMSVANWGGKPVKSTKVTPRLGLSYSIDKLTSVYGLYDQAFLPQNGILFDGSEVKPITGNNMELGIKRDWFGGKWNTTLAVYQIVKNHEIASYGPRPEMSMEIGQKKVKGIELDIKGEIAKGLNVIANYAYTDGEITKLNEGVGNQFFVGQRLDGADKHIANVWLDYELISGKLKGLSLNAGMSSNSDRATGFYSNDNPDYNLEDYLRFDGGLGYRHKSFSVRLNVNNLLDKYLLAGGAYYTNYFTTPVYSWQADAPRNYRLTMSYKF